MIETDSGWIGADPDDDLDSQLEAELDRFMAGDIVAQTVLGSVPSSVLGPMIPIQEVGMLIGTEEVGHDLALAELEDAYNSGVRCIGLVARTSAEGASIRWLAERTPLHVLEVLEIAEASLFRSPSGVMARLIRMTDASWTDVAVDAQDWIAIACDTQRSVNASHALEALRVHPQRDRMILTPWLASPEVCAARGGDSGLGSFLERLPLTLMDSGWSAPEVRRLLVDGPAEWVSVVWEGD